MSPVNRVIAKKERITGVCIQENELAKPVQVGKCDRQNHQPDDQDWEHDFEEKGQPLLFPLFKNNPKEEERQKEQKSLPE